MSEISILDLQNLRHLIGGFETSQCKMQDYAMFRIRCFLTMLQDQVILIGEFQNQSVLLAVSRETEDGYQISVAPYLLKKENALAGVNGELVRYGEMISQTENKELKQKLKQIRNDCEMSQEKLYQIAREKSYYVPAAKATDQEISHVKNILAGISTH